MLVQLSKGVPGLNPFSIWLRRSRYKEVLKCLSAKKVSLLSN